MFELTGGNVVVPEGKLVGGEFENVPVCTEAKETGCLIAYSSFLQEPPANTLFGRPSDSTLVKGPGLEVVCVNPAVETQNGAEGALLPYAPTKLFPGKEPEKDFGKPPTAPTPWVSSPGEYKAQCHKENGASWLPINPAGPAVDPPGHVRELIGAESGLYLFDVNIALGNLVNTVAIETKNYTR